MKVCVIGGGASGMVCAITLAENGHKVTVFDHKDRIGKKILSTGNGRCNISNTDQDISHYYGDEEFIKEVLSKCDLNRTVDFFTKLGIVLKDKNGYLYPYSEQASAVLDVLRFELRKLNVNIITDCDIKDIYKNTDNSFTVVNGSSKEMFERCVIATGSKAAKTTGSDGSGYDLLKKFGHTIIKPLPALTKLFSDNPVCKSVAGVRADGKVTLFVDNNAVACDRGEIQYIKDGISGIPVFQISHYASRALDYKCKVEAVIDLCPDLSIEDTYMWLAIRSNNLRDRAIEELLIGYLNKNLANAVIKNSGVKFSTLCKELSDEDIRKITNELKNMKYVITGTGDFDNAQICCGGVATDEVNTNMESNLIDGLYICGEILDVHGDCGGYNLQWAWSSGIVAGGLS